MKYPLKLLFFGYILIFPVVSVFSDGLLTVKTDPEGIEIWLNDQFIGDSPVIDKKLKPGRYSLKLVDPIQHSSTIEEIFIQDDEKTIIEKTLKSKFGILKINSAPEGAQVYISTELGNTPLSNDFMNPGKYRLELRHPNKKYKSVTQDVLIPRGETVNISKTLEKSKVLDNKAILRLVLGAGTAAGFVWGIVQQGHYKKYQTKLTSEYGYINSVDRKDLERKMTSASIMRTLGIIGGSLCLIGLEITAFF